LQLASLAGDGVRTGTGGHGLLAGACLLGAGDDLRPDRRRGLELGWRRRRRFRLPACAGPERERRRRRDHDEEPPAEQLDLVEVEAEEEVRGGGGNLGEQRKRRHEAPLLRQLTLSSTPGVCGKSRLTACAARSPSSPCSASSLPASSRPPPRKSPV